MTFDGLSPPYSTVVADPPWHYDSRSKGTWPPDKASAAGPYRSAPMPYQTLTVDEIAALPVEGLAAADAHLYLWTTNRYLRHSYGIAESWGFKPSTVLIWSKPAKGIAGDYVGSAEFVLYAKRGTLPALSRHVGSVFAWPRPPGHSTKPAAFLDLVESMSPAPRVELFARAQRFGWDSWGFGYEDVRGQTG